MIVVVIVIVSVQMLKQRNKRSHSIFSIWSTTSVTSQKETEVERPTQDIRTTQVEWLAKVERPIPAEKKPIQPVKPVPRQAGKPVVPDRKRPTPEVPKTTPALEVETVEAEIPIYCILRKDSHLKRNHENLAKNEALLHEEFLQLGVFVRDHVRKESNIAKQPEYKLHNRYRDIGKPIWFC